METNRRQFLQAAALSGVTAWATNPLLSAAEQQRGASSAATSSAEAASSTQSGGNGPVPLAPPDKQPPQLPVPEPVPRKVGWAVVGLGQLALEEVMPAFREARLSRPVALVSGHPDKARKVAEVYGIKPEAIYGYDNYERLADNPEVEVVYVILPNSMHAEYTIRGLRMGKHVLCEKPMAPTVAECEQMIAASKETEKS